MEEMLLENSVDGEGVRVLYVTGGAPVADTWINEYVPDVSREFMQAKRWESMELHHLRVKWPARGLVPWQVGMQPYSLVKQLGLWFIGAGKVSKAIQDVAVDYALGVGVDPTIAWLRTIPAGASDGFEMGPIMLIQADWVPVGFVAVGRGGDLVGQVPRYARPNPPAPSMQNVEKALSRHRVDKAAARRLL